MSVALEGNPGLALKLKVRLGLLRGKGDLGTMFGWGRSCFQPVCLH
jgi:hypothetical protein